MLEVFWWVVVVVVDDMGTTGDVIAAILAPEIANTTCFDSNTHRGSPSLCPLSPRPPWDSGN